jgi:hypothetical protein
MSRERLHGLEAQTGRPAPQGFTALSDEQLDDLAKAVHDVRRRQARELQEASEHALGHIPRLLRGPVRRLFR